MIRSMTGFGKSDVLCGDKKFTIEIRSLNSKQLDLSVRLPNELKPIEFEIRTLISQTVLRGKADFFASSETLQNKSVMQMDIEVIKAYQKQLEELSDMTAIRLPENMLGLISKFPGVFTNAEETLPEDNIKQLLLTIQEVLKQFDEFRLQEGKILKAEILNRIAVIINLLDQVEPFEIQRLDTVKNRMQKNFSELNESIKFDENRFEQELIYYIEKLDITEEKVRLRQHCNYFSETIDEENSGKKLGFITQEIGREINTLGSKANDANIQRLVVQMKDELEKVKEQLFNIL
ncbi:MAG: YicC/YloC family endoribonuclease [Bacteroidales bacterium]